MAKGIPLTKEYFEGYLGQKLDEQSQDIKAHVSSEIGELAGMTAREFRRVHARIDGLEIKLDLHSFESRLTKLEKAILSH